MARPTLLYCTAPDLEQAGLRRTQVFAERLSAHFRVVVLLAGADAELAEMESSAIEFRRCGAATSHQPSARGSSHDPGQHGALGTALINACLELAPDVILIEQYPLTRSRDPTLSDALAHIASSSRRRPLMVCSIPDVVGLASLDQQASRESAACLNRLFDVLLVHSDPAYGRLEEFYRPSERLRTVVRHTGFLLGSDSELGLADPASMEARPRRVVVAAGATPEARLLYRSAAQAQAMLWPALQLEMVISITSELPAADTAALCLAARETPGLTVVQASRDQRAELNRARWVVCDGSFGAICDALATGVGALILADGVQWTEHYQRARRLVNLGRGRLLTHRQLNAASLASSIQQLVQLHTEEAPLRLDGAQQGARLIQQLV